VTRLRHIALVVLLLLAGQMAAAAIASAACCCPAMAETDGSSPCASLSALGCCEVKAQAAVPEPLVPPAAALPAASADVFAPAAAPPAHAPLPRPTVAERALRQTILRL
jgi:hypothetical protein